ncbi:MAG: RHS repeat-associated core domain-containing protein, partial [bacterium]
VTTATLTYTNTYLWGLDVVGQRTGSYGQDAGGIGGLLAITVTSNGTSTTYLPVCDHNGNVHKVLNATNRAVVAEYEYSPYGVLIAESGSKAQLFNLRFQSKYYDRETELYYFTARYLDPRSGKWLCRDPKGEQADENLTCFCGGDPVAKCEPKGMQHNKASCYNYDFGVFVGQRNLEQSYAEYNMLMNSGVRFASSDALTTYEASAGCLETLTAKTTLYGGAVMGGGVIVAGAVSTAPVWVPAVSVTATTLAYNQFAQAAFAGGVAGLVYAADRASSWSEAVGYTVVGAGAGIAFQYAYVGVPSIRERFNQTIQTWRLSRPLGNTSGSVINPLSAKKPFVPDSYWQRQSPVQVTPGDPAIPRVKLSGDGKTVYDAVDYYDEFGRLQGQTHYTTHPGQPGISHPDPHYHLRNVNYGDSTVPRWKGTSDPEWLKNPANGTKVYPGEMPGGG